MWNRDKNSDESYIHVCEGLTEKKAKKKKIEIRLHDITTFVVVRDEKGKPDIEQIKYCPYCGCELNDHVTS